VVALSRVRLTPVERRFSWRAHRWNRLISLAVPGLSLVSVAAVPWLDGLGWVGFGAGVGLHVLLQSGLLSFFAKREGWGFAAAAAGFLFVEFLWAELAILRGLLGGGRLKD
jgi:hypothetical protein